VIAFEAVSKTYSAAKGTGGHAALKDVSLSVNAGEVFGVIGASGAGKSTLIRLINGLETPTGGKVIVDGDDVAALGVEGLRALRRRVGMIFQHFNLLSGKTVAQNVAFPLKLAGRRGQGAHGRTAGARRPDRPRRQVSGPAVGRPETAGRHRPGAGHQSQGPVVRRGHQRSRPRDN
jgi:D-methionine transport system ATP-binding protein